MRSSTDVLVAGGGPSAIALALEADLLGLSVRLVAPDAPGHAESTLAFYADEAAGAPLRSRASRTVVEACGGHNLQRGYAVLDLPAYAALLPTRVDVVQGRVARSDGRVTVLDDGTVLHARAVVDATGSASALVELEPSRPAWQTAFGQIVEGDVGLAPDTALLMDWSSPHRPRSGSLDGTSGSASDGPDDGVPTFLYALPLEDGRFLVEETVLCARPAVSIDALRRRLEVRLAQRGARITRVHAEERVAIPMGTGLPVRGQHVAAFGAALGLVHPTTGYSVARTMALAPRVAGALCRALEQGDGKPMGDVVLDAVWDREARDARALYMFAMEAARRFSRAEAERFFAAFFAQPATHWRGFLAGTLEVRELRAAMLNLFTRGGTRMRLALAKGLFAPASLGVMRGFLGGAA